MSRNKIINFCGTQLDMLKYKGKELAYPGPCGTGKSYAVLAKIYLMAKKYEQSRYLIVRDTRAALTQSTLVTLEKNIMPTTEPSLLTGGSRRTRSSYVFSNGSEIVFGGMKEPERILSTEYDIVMIEEATQGISHEDYETLKSRLRNFKTPYQQIIIVCNPGSPHHWIKQEIDKGTIYCINAKHEDNPLFYDQKTKKWTDRGLNYLDTLKGFSEIKRKRLLEGVWVAQEGLIFNEWDSEQHIIDNIEDIEFDRYLGVVDFGYTDAGVAMLLGQAHEGELYIISVDCRTKMDINWWAKRILEIQGEENVVWVCDSASPSSIKTLEQAGIQAIPCKKGRGSKLKNVSAIKHRLINNKLFYYSKANLNPDPNLLKEKKPWNLPQEMELYSWRIKNGVTLEEPQDGDDHHLDALGYIINYVDAKKVSFAFA